MNPGSASEEGTTESSSGMTGGVCVMLTWRGSAFDLKAEGVRLAWDTYTTFTSINYFKRVNFNTPWFLSSHPLLFCLSKTRHLFLRLSMTSWISRSRQLHLQNVSYLQYVVNGTSLAWIHDLLTSHDSSVRSRNSRNSKRSRCGFKGVRLEPKRV